MLTNMKEDLLYLNIISSTHFPNYSFTNIVCGAGIFRLERHIFKWSIYNVFGYCASKQIFAQVQWRNASQIYPMLPSECGARYAER